MSFICWIFGHKWVRIYCGTAEAEVCRRCGALNRTYQDILDEEHYRGLGTWEDNNV